VLCISDNPLTGLPDALANLRSLEELDLRGNRLPSVPVTVLSRLTSLTRLSLASSIATGGSLPFRVTSPLQPILHLGLVHLCLAQRYTWDTGSLHHLGRALVEVAGRWPIFELVY
jgi:hypothetical protein